MVIHTILVLVTKYGKIRTIVLSLVFNFLSRHYSYFKTLRYRHADGKMIEVRIQVLVLWNVAEGTRGHIGHAQIQHQG